MVAIIVTGMLCFTAVLISAMIISCFKGSGKNE